jgi:hypothetical protein
MKHKRFGGGVVGGLTTGGLLVLAFAGCPHTAEDCNYTLTCPPPSCAEGGDVQGCIPDASGEDGGDDAQEN